MKGNVCHRKYLRNFIVKVDNKRGYLSQSSLQKLVKLEILSCEAHTGVAASIFRRPIAYRSESLNPLSHMLAIKNFNSDIFWPPDTTQVQIFVVDLKMVHNCRRVFES